MSSSPGTEAAAQAAEPIVRLLRSCREDWLAKARFALLGFGADAPAVMAAVLRRCLAADRRNGLTRSAAALLLSVGGFMAWWALEPTGWGPLAFGIGISALMAAVGVWAYSGMAERAAALLGAYDRASTLAVLIDALWMDRGVVRVQAASLMADRLPALPVERALALGPSQRSDIYRLLGCYHTRRLAEGVGAPHGLWLRCDRAILDLARRTGDPLAMPHVAALAAWAGRSPIGREARACLEDLREAAARQQTAASLLRPAGAPEEPALLRPAGAETGVPTEQLLRPAGQADE